MPDPKKKFRTDFRKNRQTGKRRENDLTRNFGHAESARDDESADKLARGERISGKGDLTRKRTVLTDHAATGEQPTLSGTDELLRGRVLSVFGLTSAVEAADGTIYKCGTRRILKTLNTDERQVVASGDWVRFRPAADNEGLIEIIEPRHGVLSRTSRGRRHTMVANVDQLLLIGSAAEPYLKPNLIDRFIVSAEQAGLRPIIGINKVDLVEPSELQPLVGVYTRMGYPTLLLSAKLGRGVERLRALLNTRATVIVGQSGVGKSSLLNMLDPNWSLRTSAVSGDNQKGRHTTTTAKLLKIAGGGYVVDTPGIRQFQLWDLIPEEVAEHFRDLRPFANRCKFPNCTHTHEAGCAVKDAVADGFLDARRYESYCSLRASEEDDADAWE